MKKRATSLKELGSHIDWQAAHDASVRKQPDGNKRSRMLSPHIRVQKDSIYGTYDPDTGKVKGAVNVQIKVVTHLNLSWYASSCTCEGSLNPFDICAQHEEYRSEYGDEIANLFLIDLIKKG